MPGWVCACLISKVRLKYPFSVLQMRTGTISSLCRLSWLTGSCRSAVRALLRRVGLHCEGTWWQRRRWRLVSDIWLLLLRSLYLSTYLSNWAFCSPSFSPFLLSKKIFSLLYEPPNEKSPLLAGELVCENGAIKLVKSHLQNVLSVAANNKKWHNSGLAGDFFEAVLHFV